MASIVFPLLVFAVGLLMFVACSTKTLKEKAAVIGLVLLAVGALVLTWLEAGHVSKL